MKCLRRDLLSNVLFLSPETLKRGLQKTCLTGITGLLYRVQIQILSPCIIDINPPWEKRWRLHILPQYLANPSKPIRHMENHIFAIFFPVPTTLLMLRLKIFGRTFLFFPTKDCTSVIAVGITLIERRLIAYFP